MSYNTYSELSNVALEAPKAQVLTDAQYADKAKAQYDPSYNLKVTGLQNTLRNSLTSLDSNRATIDANYEKAAAAQNLQNKTNINSLNNDALNRGLGRSSIVTSGIASANLANSKALASIMSDKVNSLNSLALQESNAKADEQNTENTMAANRLDDLQTLSDKLKNQDWDRYDNELNANRSYYMQQLGYNNNIRQMNDSNYWKNQEFDYQKQKDAQSLALQYAQLEVSKANKAASNSSASAKAEQTNIDNAAYKNFQASSIYEQRNMLNDKNFISNVSPTMYAKIKADYQNNLENSKKTDAQINQFNQASKPLWDYNSSFLNGSLNAGRSR